MLQQRERSDPCSLSRPILSASVSRKILERGRLAADNAQRFKIEKLNIRNEPQQDRQYERRCRNKRMSSRLRLCPCGSLDERSGKPKSDRHLRSARAILPAIPLVIEARRCSNPCSISTRISSSRLWPNSSACAAARSIEMAISPSSSPARGEREYVRCVVVSKKVTVQTAAIPDRQQSGK